MYKVIQEYNPPDDTVEKYLNEGYELKFVVPETKSFYADRQIVTVLLYIFVKKEKEL